MNKKPRILSFRQNQPRNMRREIYMSPADERTVKELAL